MWGYKSPMSYNCILVVTVHIAGFITTHEPPSALYLKDRGTLLATRVINKVGVAIRT